jgi:hypothetical protein
VSRPVKSAGLVLTHLLPVAVTALCTSAATSAQTPPSAGAAGVVDYGLSADTIGFGDRFELRIALQVPAGQTAHLPSLIRGNDGFEGLPVGEPPVEPLPGGARAVTVHYPLIPYRVGLVTIPELAPAFVLSPADSGDVAVAFYDPSDGPPSAPFASTLLVPRQEVWVESVLLADDITEGLVPRPPDDVVGPSWHAPALFSAVAFGTLLLGVLFVSSKDWLEARSRADSRVGKHVDPIAAARQRALDELDRLLVSDLPGSDTAGFYERTSAAVRRYVEHFDVAWGPADTSTELMDRLEAQQDPGAVRGLTDDMHVAEVVKFGRLRPDVESAERHCRGLRAWVASS